MFENMAEQLNQEIIVASKNPVKIQAAHDGFQRMFPDIAFTVRGLSVPSGVPDQPLTDEETLQGALNRAPLAAETLEKIRNLDADPRIMIVIAHDTSVLDALPMFPHGTINAWKENGYKEAIMWNWVKELPQNGKRMAPFLVDGLYREGKKVREALQL
ncbi:hypothetical protein NQ176_g7113 [Zarea fungicola]|uniref:Uncharacterized protein n=1 Tax=Zarea fungicola TaxID=93591 RepID=A0ACC1N0T7_9HYPO|nr:hypothetical protein NQ176_g7113 [Lecanicillium fungicola]